MAECHHECELFTGRQPEAAESEHNWKTCEKNPGHDQFISVPQYVHDYEPKIQQVRQRSDLRAVMDLTVRLRVRYTSLKRPEGDDFSDDRGTDKLRVGTGYIWFVGDPVLNARCQCCGKIKKKQWKLEVQTALHVVYDTEEAKHTVVDLFYDDSESQDDGRMKSVRGMEVFWSIRDRDLCRFTCVICDEDLGERLEAANSYPLGDDGYMPIVKFSDFKMPESWHKDCDIVLIVSHPHAQPKQITVGELRYKAKKGVRQYTASTCPGSSGAPVFVFYRKEEYFIYYKLTSIVHNGSYGKASPERKDRPILPIRLANKLRGRKSTPIQQLNYGHYDY